MKAEAENSIQKIHLEQNAIFIGARAFLFEEVQKTFLENFENVEFFKISKLEISVEDIQNVRDLCYKSTSENLRAILLSSFYWNTHSQNALLKLLEETPTNIKIIMIASDTKTFLPTILSRVFCFDFQNLNEGSKDEIILQKLAVEILSTPIYLRLQNSKIKKLLLAKTININSVDIGVVEVAAEDEDDEIEENDEKEIKGKRKDREKHMVFCEVLIVEIIKKWRGDNGLFNKEYIQKINIIKNNLNRYGSSPHMYLEYILLSTPKI